MNETTTLTLDDLREMCQVKEPESELLEFKTCNALVIGSPDHHSEDGTRQHQKVVEDLSKQVSAFLNSGGGRIIYGIAETRNSRARKLDRDNAFRQGGKKELRVTREKVIHWICSHVKPLPVDVNVYSVPLDPTNPDESPWFIVVDVQQGLQPYQAENRIFYKRVGSTAQPMMQWDIMDVANRTRGADLEVELTISLPPSKVNDGASFVLYLGLKISTKNYIPSEYGALRLTLADPLTYRFGPGQLPSGWRFEAGAGLPLPGEDDDLHAHAVTGSWNISLGHGVLPGFPYDFEASSLGIPTIYLEKLSKPTFFVQVQLFTAFRQPKNTLFAIQGQSPEPIPNVIRVDDSNLEALKALFRETLRAHHEAHKHE